MAYQNRAHLYFPVVEDPNTTTSILVLDASGEKAGFVFRAPKSGNIAKVHFALGTVTTGESLQASLQDVDGSGNPDGTADQSGTVSVANSDDNTFKTVTFGATRSVTRGDLLSVVIEFSATTGNLQILCGSLLLVNNHYALLFTGAWAKQARAPVMVLEYDDGSFAPLPGGLVGPSTTVDFANSSTPDEIALRVSLPFPARVMGLAFFGRLTGDADLVLYSGTTALATVSLDTDVKQSAGDQLHVGLFPAAQDLAAGTVYRAAVKPTTATNARIFYNTVATADHLDGACGGKEQHFSQRTDAGAWSDTTTRRPSIYLVCEAFDDGAGAGGGLLRHPGMMGGCPA